LARFFLHVFSTHLFNHLFDFMAGYSQTPLLKKLGLKSGATACIINPPAMYFNALAPLAQDVVIKTSFRAKLDFVHFFVANEADFRKHLITARDHLEPNGMIWVSWPKGLQSAFRSERECYP
jgi:hypothetical protein